MPAFQQSAADQTFAEVERLVYHTAHRFRRRYRGDWEDVKSDAFLGYCKAYRDHQGDRARFTTWVARSVWYACLDGHKRRSKVKERQPTLSIDPATAVIDQAPEASSDADAATRAALSERGGSRSATVRLLREAGWCALRIAESFGEMRSLLS